MSDPAIYTECTPIDIDGQEMTEAVILSDINGRDKNNNLATVMHFFMFIICILFSTILTPFFFNLIGTNSGILTKVQGTEDSISTAFQICIILFFLGYSMLVAVSSNTITLTTIGSFMFIYVFLSGCIMYFLKTISPGSYSLAANLKFNFGDSQKITGGIVLSAIIMLLTWAMTSRKKNKKKKKSSNAGLYTYGILVGFVTSYLFVPVAGTNPIFAR